jgi:predicted RNase H-like nuclease (RuvC/YqgF family)
MYYETKIINGVLCERFSPKLAFRECSREKITSQMVETEQALIERGRENEFLSNENESLKKEIEEFKSAIKQAENSYKDSRF